MSDVTFDMRFNQMNIYCGYAEPWRVTLVDTGDQTMTGGRLKRVKEHIGSEICFICFTYGDGVSNVNIQDLIAFHHQQKTLATLKDFWQPMDMRNKNYLEEQWQSGNVPWKNW